MNVSREGDDEKLLELLLQRRSVALPDLRDPGPDAAQLERILSAAIRVPDHGKLAPWRIRVVRGEDRARLSAVIGRVYREEAAEFDAGRFEKVTAMPRFAPVLVVVGAHLTRGHKIPEIEQLLSGGALCQNLIIAANASGFATNWITGWAASSPGVRQALGFDAKDDILGFIGIGTASRLPPDRPRPALADVVSDWRPGTL